MLKPYPDLIGDVRQFQEEVLGVPHPPEPVFYDEPTLQKRVACLDEELNELIVAETIADQADALVDTIYFALGILHSAGIDTKRVWDEVHRANMSKRLVETERLRQDAAKPPGFRKPDHSWLDQ